MTRKYKVGCKVWVKARVVSSRGVGDDEVVVRIRTSFGESTIGVVPTEDVIRDTSPWQPIETAPRDGTVVLVGWKIFGESTMAFYKNGTWFSEVNRYEIPEPTHYMLIPPLDVRVR